MFNLRKYIPDAFAPDVFKIDYQRLWDIGIRTLVFDADRTLKKYHDKDLPKEIIDLFAKLKNMRFKIVIVTNTIVESRTRQAKSFAKSAEVDCVCLGFRKKKPNSWGIVEAMRITNSNREETAVIGDDATRDVIAGKRAGVHRTILVAPIGWLPHWQYPAFWIQRLRDFLTRRKIRHHSDRGSNPRDP